MATIQCKICGSHMELPLGRTLGECAYCGSQVTLPQVHEETHASAFDRGNHFRRIGEFDKALAVYERVVQQDETSAEAHWCSALSRFGIEYVKDPATGEYLPTCHRASYDSFLEDVDYLAALAHSEGATRQQYQRDAEKIAAVLRGVIATSQTEAPFDVFICYKETDANGQRTHDSALAQDVYYQLTDQGLRVFFARITLEDKPGAQYEPYIFAALNTAKVMVVIGTKPEHLSAPWVKNEWSRYLSLIKRDRSRLLIPCYRDMDPYDMPEQLSILQGYDMSRIGFIQDLVRGIRKVVGEEKSAAPAPQAAPATTAAPAAPATEPLLRRAALFLEDGDWKSADEYCERVLDIDPENARAYVGKLMAALHVTQQEKLKDQAQPFDQNPNYKKALRFADEELAVELQNTIAHVKNVAKEEAYHKAEQAMMSATTELSFVNAQVLFESLGNWRDAPARAQECETRRIDYIYNTAMNLMRGSPSLNACKQAISLLQGISDWRDVQQEIEVYRQRIPELVASERARKEAQLAFMRASRQYVIAAKAYHTVGLCADGSVVAVGRNDRGQCNISAWSDIVAIAAGKYHTVGLRADGSVVAVGWNCFGECNTSTWSDIVAIATGDSHTVGLRTDGSVVAVGNNGCGQCDTSAWSDIVAIAADARHTVGLCADGSVVAVGWNSSDQCNTSAWSDIIAIAAGLSHTVGLHVDGSVAAVGWNSKTQCNTSAWSDIVAIAAVEYHTVGLRADGSVVAVGWNNHGQCNISTWTDIVAIATGDSHTIGLRADGSVVAVGNNIFGQCDVTDWRLKTVPRPTLPE